METKINVWIRTWALALGWVFASMAGISTNALAQSAAQATAPATAATAAANAAAAAVAEAAVAVA